MILMNITCIFCYKVRIGLIKNVGTSFIRKIKIFLIMKENIFGDVLDSCNVPAIIFRYSGVKPFSSRMGDNFVLGGISFTICSSLIVVAFNPELKVALTLNHRIIDFFVLTELFQIGDIASSLAATYSDDNIQ